MSGLLNDPNNQPGGANRLLLAMVVMMGMLLIYQSFVTPPPSPDDESEEEASDGDEGSADQVAESEGSAEPVVVADVPDVDALPEQILRTDNSELRFTNLGGRLAAVEIISPERYQPHEDISGVFPVEGDEMLPLVVSVDGMPDLTDDALYSLELGEGGSVLADGAEYDEETSQEYDRIVYRWVSPDGALSVEKIFESAEEAFATNVTIRVTNHSDRARRFDDLEVALDGSYDPEAGGMFDQAASMLGMVCSGEMGTKRKPAARLKETKFFSGAVDFLGIDERYFMTAVAVRGDQVPIACHFDAQNETHARAAMVYDEFELGPDQYIDFELVLYAGPKDVGFMNAVDGDLSQAIDFGWFSFLAIPIRILLLFFQGLVTNWGVAIILLTITIKLFLFPVTQKAFTNMEKMREIQPELTKLQEKYEHDPMKRAEEQMKLFKESGTSPAGGCLPMLLQMPIYFALYRTIWGSTELYNAEFALWITDLSQRDPYFVLPVLMGGVMFFQQRLMPQTVDNPQMQMMQKVMPVMFTVFMLFLPSGLVLYIFVNMLLSIAQQLWIRRHKKKDGEDTKKDTKSSKK